MEMSPAETVAVAAAAATVTASVVTEGSTQNLRHRH
eukprot:COSAG01_NODE_72236_length_253_cov_1.272727_1_plen_35_part_10